MEVIDKQGVKLEVTAKVVQQVLAFLSGLARTEATTMVTCHHTSVFYHTITITPRIDNSLGIDIFYFLVLVW